MNSERKKGAADPHLDRFLKTLRPHLFAFAYSLGGVPDDADDVVQNALLETFLLSSVKNEFALDRKLILKSYELALEEMRGAIGALKPWRFGDDNIVKPLLTAASFWEPFQNGAKSVSRSITSRERFHLGFLTILQRLAFLDRVIYALIRLEGFAADETAGIVGFSEAEVAKRLAAAEEIMAQNYFSRDGANILWRGAKAVSETPGDAERLSALVEIINRRQIGAFRKLLDPPFRCLLQPAPFIPEEIFFNDFLKRVPYCRMLDFEVNGMTPLAFDDDREIQALGLVVFSEKGVATILGFDVLNLPTKISVLLTDQNRLN